MLDGASLGRAIEAVAAVREAVGDSVDMLIECHGRFNAKSAARAAETLRPYGIYFMEGTVHPRGSGGAGQVQVSGASAHGSRRARGEQGATSAVHTVCRLHPGEPQEVRRPHGGQVGRDHRRDLRRVDGVSQRQRAGPTRNHRATRRGDTEFRRARVLLRLLPQMEKRIDMRRFPVENGHVEIPISPA